ncbi:uncharacterized protein MYCGRDRAFT_102085, partial [Zymoseptoria tritici IPO323]
MVNDLMYRCANHALWIYLFRLGPPLGGSCDGVLILAGRTDKRAGFRVMDGCEEHFFVPCARPDRRDCALHPLFIRSVNHDIDIYKTR